MRNKLNLFQLTIVLSLIVITGRNNSSYGQITLTQDVANNYVANICGPGITFSNVTLTGDSRAIAKFLGGTSAGLGASMNSGVVLSTGLVNSATALQGAPAAFSSGNNNGGTIPELDGIAGDDTYDGIILEFDFIPITNNINVNYIFGSEEYNEWVNAGYNDAFAFYISGPGIAGTPNIAVLPGNIPVTIDNINLSSNSTLYRNNISLGNANLMDGYTAQLTASSAVTACQTYHIRLMIADGGDDIYDSWVFIQENGLFAVGNPPLSLAATYPFGTALYEECFNNNTITFTIPTAQAANYSFNVTWGGTATSGVDYSSLPTTITIPAGQTSINLPISVFTDALTEGIETIECTYPVSVCSMGTAIINIDDAAPLTVDAGPNTDICGGAASATLTATSANGNGTVTYSWDNGAGSTASVSVSPASTTTYTVTATDQCGRTATDQVTVAVGTPPVIDAGPNTSICQGASATLSASGGVSYTWDNGLGAGNGVAVSPASTTTYNVTGTAANGCSSTDAITVTVTPGPVVNAGPDQTICQGAAVTVSGSGAVSYTWNNGASNGVPFTPGSTQTYTVTGTDGNGCQGTDQVTITVNPLPAVNAGTDPVICQGGSITLSGSGAQSYSWNNGATNGVSFTPASTQTYTVTGTDANGCQNTDQVLVTVSSGLNVGAGSDQSVCPGGSVTLSGSGAVSYSWNNGVTDGASFTPVSTQTYTVTGTDANGCQGTDQVTITVNTLPVVNAGADQTICQGAAIAVSGSGVQSYSWNNGVTNGVSFTPVSTQTYTVTGTDANGCQGTDQVTITVNPLPTVNAGSDQSVCPGGSVTLSGSGAQSYSWNNGVTNGVSFVPASTQTYTVTGTDANGCQNTDQVVVTVNSGINVSAGADQSICTGGSITLTGSGAVSYSWNNGVTNGVSFTPTSTQTYTVTGTDANGCQGTDQVTITVNSLPTINAGTDQVICQGQSITLGGSGAQSYSWNNGVTNGVSFIPGSTQTYTVTGTDANGCQNTDQATVTVNPLPAVNAGSDQSVCAGGSVTLSGSGAVSYSWNNGVTDGVSFVPAATQTYTVTGTDANGCQNTDQVVVTVNPLPNVGAGADQAICEGSQITLNGLGAATYTWSNGVQNNTGFTPPLGVNTYIVTGTSAAGCQNTATVTVTVVPVPTAVLGSNSALSGNPGLSVEFTNSSTNATSYDFDFGNGFDHQTTNVAATPGSVYQSPGTYTVVLTASNGICQDTAQLLVVVVPYAPMTVIVPNIFTPNGDGNNDAFFVKLENAVSLDLIIVNRWGNFMAEINDLNGSWDGNVNGNIADDGVYFYKYTATGLDGSTQTGHGNIQLIRN